MSLIVLLLAAFAAAESTVDLRAGHQLLTSEWAAEARLGVCSPWVETEPPASPIEMAEDDFMDLPADRRTALLEFLANLIGPETP